MRRLIAIVGPTASGKSAIALELAQRLGGEIVNADSRQIYRGMDVGTAKPSAAERASVPHHLFDIADPSEMYSLALYQRDARAALEDIWSRGSFAWLVGGTGQYIWGLLEDWRVPEVPPDLEFRAELVAIADSDGPEALHGRLAHVDPLAASRIDARNIRRVVRAIEVFERTGRPISEWQTKGQPDFEYLLFGVSVPKNVLDERIAARVDAMIADGLVGEVERLRDAGIPSEAPAFSSIGYAQVLQHLGGALTLTQAIDEAARATRRLARRQAQWFRPGDPRIRWVAGSTEMELDAGAFTRVSASHP